MLRDRPHYLDGAGASEHALRFMWDEWDVKSTYSRVDEQVQRACEQLSWRANTALTIGIGEWIVERFSRLHADAQPSLFLDAAWVGLIDTERVVEPVIDDDYWHGPILGPVSMAMSFVSDALFAEEAQPNAALNPGWAASFAKHVLPDASAFDRWLARALTTLAQASPVIPEDDLDWFDASANRGAMVCPEQLDPQVVVPDANERMQRYVQRVISSRNPFLQ